MGIVDEQAASSNQWATS